MLRAMVSAARSIKAPINPEANKACFMDSPKRERAINGAANPRKATAPIDTER